MCDTQFIHVHVYACILYMYMYMWFFFSVEVLSGGSSDVVTNGAVQRGGAGEGEGEEERRREGDDVFTERAVLQTRNHSIMRTSGECLRLNCLGMK